MPRLLIKNMVCHRCILSVENILHELKIPFTQVSMGEVELEEKISHHQNNALIEKLHSIGFELIDNHQTALIEKIKQLIIQKARNEVTENEKKWKLSKYITHHVPNEYTYLSSLFSEIEGRTIEHYFIEQRIEKVKELLVYDQLTLSQIAFQLDYSSVAHLSSQFKKITGLTPTYFKTLGNKKRKSIDNV
jgi:AraC family transcriptional regulator